MSGKSVSGGRDMRPPGSPINRRALIAKLRGPKRATIALAEKASMRAEGSLRRCPVPGCGRQPAALTGNGLSQVYCRRCSQRAARHGCHWKLTYAAGTLETYRRAARRFIRAKPNDIWIAHSLQALQAQMDAAGPVERIVDVYDRAPIDKARAALARMRRREVPPEALLVNFVAVCCAIAEDPVSAGSEATTFRRVQVAKACARLAASNDGLYQPRKPKEKYARSTGHFLIHLGAMLEEACEHVVEKHLAAVLASVRGQRSKGAGDARG